MSGAWATHEPWRMVATLLTHLAFMVSVYTVVTVSYTHLTLPTNREV